MLRLKGFKRQFLSYSFPPRSPGPHHLAVLAHPGFVRAAPALPAATRVRLPSATSPCCDRATAKVSHLHSNNSASRRTHRAKQARGWAVTKPRPGWTQWTTRAGRTYLEGPWTYPALGVRTQ